MKSAAEFLGETRALGIKLWEEEGQLCFEAPKGAVTPSLRRKLGRWKPQILKYLIEKGKSPATDHEYFPLSANQEQLWFSDQLNPDSSLYNIPAAIRIQGKLDVTAVETAIHEMVRRHTVLRTVFPNHRGSPSQRVMAPQNVPLVVKHFPSSSGETQMFRWVKKEAQRPFNLAVGPLFRPMLWMRSETEYLLQLTLHHILADGWSMRVFLEEWSTLYGAQVREKPVNLPPIPLTYGELALRESQNKGANPWAPQISYWQEKLAGHNPILNLPFDRPRPQTRSYRGAVAALVLSEDDCLRIKALGRQENTTLFVTLISAFQVLLFRYSDQKDATIGFLSSNRTRETEGLMGYFVNTLPLRMKIHGNASFRDVLGRMRKNFLAALTNGDVPFARVVDALKVKRDLSYHPVFQILVAQENAPSQTLNQEGLRLDYRLVDFEKSKFDLTLFIGENHQLELKFEYNRDLFEASTINRILAHLEATLQMVGRSPDSEVATLPFMSDSETRQILVEWNDTEVAYPLQRNLADWIEDQVLRSQDKVALLLPQPDGTAMAWTYGALNQRANQLAHYLRELGAGRDILIAVFMERSLEMVVSLLGILKSGSAYLPLSPEDPPARISMMVQDAAPPILLTQKVWVPQLPDFDGKAISLDMDWHRAAGHSDSNPTRSLTSESLAYVIFTSGSTGQPKGVMNIHRAICNRLLWMQERFQLLADDSVLQKTPFSFDVSVWEFFWPLMFGARLVLAKPAGHRDNSYLIDIIGRYRVTTLHFVPSMLRYFLQADGVEVVNRCVKRVICSGEALSADLRDQFFEHFKFELHNLYGPTEAAIDVTAWQCQSRSPEKASVPIGIPIANTQIHLLDRHLQPVPIGTPGHLFIGGLNLARGYVKRAALTAERFIPNPFRGVSGGRLYGTGDRARYRTGGIIDFMGRFDEQVKVRGFRIEPAEIEISLEAHPDIKQALVLVSCDSQKDNQLHAYCVAKGARLSVEALRKFLKTKLPGYMIPATFLMLDAMPLNANGKVDRGALPKPGGHRPHLETRFVAPATPVEKTLAKIWRQVLGMEEVGIGDNFFSLGGDSIKCIRVLYLAKEEGIHFSIQDVFEYQTIGDIAKIAQINRDTVVAHPSTRPFDLVKGPDREKLPKGLADAYPLSMLQTGLVYHSNESAEYAVYITSYHLRARYNHQHLLAALDSTLLRHPMLRTSFDMASYSEPLQLVHRTAVNSLTIKDWREFDQQKQDHMLDQWIEAQRTTKFNWQQPPLFRFFVHRRGPESFQFTIVEPLLDGWSVALLATEIFHNYQDRLQGGQTPNLQPPNSTYRDYVALERRALENQAAHTFWMNQLQAGIQTMLPRWGPFFKEGSGPRFVRKRAILSPRISADLNRISRTLAVPLKTVLLALHLRVIGFLSGQPNPLTGLMSNGRPEEREGEGIIGLFLNVLPFGFDLTGLTWTDLIKQTFATEMRVLPYRRYPLAQIRLDRKSQLFDTVFNFIHFYPYRDFMTGDGLNLLAIKANDQTYFSLTAQFSLDWRTDQVHLTLDFNATEIGDFQIDCITEYYSNGLANLTDSLDEPCLSRSLFSQAAREQILCKWNATDLELATDLVFGQLFKRQVKRNPDAVAVADEDGQLTYRQLDIQSDHMANTLHRNGVGLEAMVGLLADRNTDFLIAVLGIFKAGAVYVPLHPGWPPSRISQISRQSGYRLIITNAPYTALVSQSLSQIEASGRPLVLTMTGPKPAQGKRPCPPSKVLPNSLAYVIYTSGSTGVPKGAMVEHRGMINHIFAKIHDLQLDQSVVIAQTASQSFDISVWQFLTPLLLGGKVIVVRDGIAKDPMALIRFLQEKNVHTFETVPTLLRAILETLDYMGKAHSRFPALRWLLVTGEAFPLDLLVQWQRRYSQIPVVNAYGPTECSDDVAHFIGGGDRTPCRKVVPIGRPVCNTKLYILDQHIRPLPIGAPGQIYVAGTGVGRGYLKDACQTAETFVPDPFSQRGGRLYKTGDLARFLVDGNIEFMGRMDHQIKFRGLRLEFGEIEATLRLHSTVSDSVVVKRIAAAGEEIVAYVVPAPKENLVAADLRDHLRQRLPDYMVPFRYVELTALPFNQNGKVDRAALPDTNPDIPRVQASITPPGNSLERRLVEIWQQVLGVKPLGIHCDFFDLGGHSLQAIQLVSKVSMATGQEVSVKFLMTHPCVSAMAETLSARTAPMNPDSKGKGPSNPNLNGNRNSGRTPFSYLKLERRCLQDLIVTGEIEPVDAAALGYLPSSLLNLHHFSRAQIVDDLFKNRPLIRRVFTTPLGRIGHIVLPRFSGEIYDDPDDLLETILKALRLARQTGAKSVSLTGLIPSATNYGRSIAAKMDLSGQWPSLTTGHATTTAAVIFSIENLLEKSGRDLSQEKVCILGMGSIGLASLRLLLKVLPHPREIALCDLYAKTDMLLQVEREIVQEYGYQGTTQVLASGAVVDDRIYDATFIIGATNVEDVIDVARLKPGTLIVDDSAPHCFNSDQAIARLEERQDILFCEGGMLRSPQPIEEYRYYPDGGKRSPFDKLINYRTGDYDIMGCIFSSILPTLYSELPSILGLANIKTCVRHYQKLTEIGFKGVDLCCKDYRIPESKIREFCQRTETIKLN